MKEGRESAAEAAKTIRSAAYEDIEAVVARYAEDPRKQVQAAIATAKRRYEKERAERGRVAGMYALEREMAGGGIAIGVDEVGRGAIAGPLTVGAVALPAEPMIWGLNDSKQLTPERREELAVRIADTALAIGIAHVPPETIDAVGIAEALRFAMREAVANAGIEPDAVLIDGNPIHAHPKERTLVKGDARIASIAAASIVAKVTRDHLMMQLAQDYPAYHWEACKGYGSPEHIAAIKELGLTKWHRRSFCGNFIEEGPLF